MTFPLVIAAFGQTVFMLLLGAVALFLILLVLVQRGRGGGLAGALGGMGGSSAFGAKAGDVFTKITVVVATLWILLCIVGSKMTPTEASLLDTKVSATSASTDDGLSMGVPAKETSEELSEEDSAATQEEAESSTEGEESSDAPAETSSPAESAETE